MNKKRKYTKPLKNCDECKYKKHNKINKAINEYCKIYGYFISQCERKLTKKSGV